MEKDEEVEQAKKATFLLPSHLPANPPKRATNFKPWATISEYLIFALFEPPFAINVRFLSLDRLACLFNSLGFFLPAITSSSCFWSVIPPLENHAFYWDLLSVYRYSLLILLSTFKFVVLFLFKQRRDFSFINWFDIILFCKFIGCEIIWRICKLGLHLPWSSIEHNLKDLKTSSEFLNLLQGVYYIEFVLFFGSFTCEMEWVIFL